MDFDACSCSGSTLGKLLRPAILATLASGPSHGYAIHAGLGDLEGLAERPPDHTGVYRALRSMEEEGLVSSIVAIADKGPSRRRYRLTTSGRKCLARWRRTLVEYRRRLDALLSRMEA